MDFTKLSTCSNESERFLGTSRSGYRVIYRSGYWETYRSDYWATYGSGYWDARSRKSSNCAALAVGTTDPLPLS